MSILKTHNLQSPDSGSVNIALAPNAGMVVSGISTFNGNIINSTGKIGIGTNNPNTLFHVHHATTNGLALFESSDAYCHITFQDSNSNTTTKPHFGVQGDDFRFVSHDGSSATEKLRITSDGKVGVNVTSPAALMHVSGSYAAPTGGFGGSVYSVISNSGAANNSCGLSINAGNNGVSFVQFGDTDDANVGTIEYLHSDNSMVFDTAAGERLRIGSAGQLGIVGANYGDAGQVLKSGGSGAAPTWGAGGNFTSYAIVAEVRSGTSDAGTLTANTWMTRAINTEIADPDGIVSISSNQFTLQAGTYLIEWSAPAWRCDRHTTRLYDVTNSAARGNATLEFSQDSGSYTQSSSRGFARVTISGATEYRLQTRGNVTKSGDGLGIDPNNLASCIYAMAKIYKEV